MSKTIVLTWQDIVSFFIYARLSQYTVLSFTFSEINVFVRSINKTALDERVNIIINSEDYNDADAFIDSYPEYFIITYFKGIRGFSLAFGLDKNEIFCKFLPGLNAGTYKLLKTAFDDRYED